MLEKNSSLTSLSDRLFCRFCLIYAIHQSHLLMHWLVKNFVPILCITHPGYQLLLKISAVPTLLTYRSLDKSAKHLHIRLLILDNSEHNHHMS